MKVLVSACLLGENCKYNGGNNYSEKLKDFLTDNEIIPVCPEVLGGLSVPRKPAEIVDGTVRTRDGESVDREFRLGAEKALRIAKENGVDYAVLQSRSPSCGAKQVYDGSFSGNLIDSMGVFAELLMQHGFKVVDVEDII